MSFQAQRTLSATELADVLSLRHDKAAEIISRLCLPLASIVDDRFRLSHPSVREFFELQTSGDYPSVGILFSKAHELLAEKCLLYLSDERYSRLDGILSHLRANQQGHLLDRHPKLRTDPFYDYASRYWNNHLTRVKSPAEEILHKANTFLQNLQFTYWAEYTRKDSGQLVGVTKTLLLLRKWHKRLSVQQRAIIDLQMYFEHAYNRLSAALMTAGDAYASLLVKMSIGDFQFDNAKIRTATNTREQVLEGLDGLQERQDVIWLSAKSGLAITHLYNGKIKAARESFTILAHMQRKMLGDDSLLHLETLLYLGQSDDCMMDFSAAVCTWTKASVEALRLLGPTSWQYQAAQMWYAAGIAQLDQLDDSLRILRSVLKRRHAQFGPEDTFASLVQILIGIVLRMLRRFEESISNLEHVLEGRCESFDLCDIWRLDVELALAASYQNAKSPQAAHDILSKSEADGCINIPTHFERFCQVKHIKGNILAETGNTDAAISLFQDTLIQAEKSQDNRTLLWIRLDLAHLLRWRNGDGDADQACMNFDNILKDISGEDEPGFRDEPNPPRLLALSERVLTLIRARRHNEACHELLLGKATWATPSDLWLWIGATVICDT